MNEEKLKQILNNIGRIDVPPHITSIAEQTLQSFTVARNLLQAQRPQRTRFVIGLRLLAAAAVIIFAFAIGLSVGRRSKPTPSFNVAAYTPAMSAYSTVQTNTDSFWRQKTLAAMQPRSYTRNQLSQTALLNVYKQYLKEKHYD